MKTNQIKIEFNGLEFQRLTDYYRNKLQHYKYINKEFVGQDIVPKARFSI